MIVKIFKKLFLAALINLMTATVALAGGTEKEALAMLDRGIAYIKAHGTEEAFKAFTDLNNKEFHDRDLYLYAYDFKGFNVAHGTNKLMVGKNFMEMKDAAGKTWLPEMIEIAKTQGSGSLDFMWNNPETKKIQAKIGYIKKIPGQDMFLGTGIYK